MNGNKMTHNISRVLFGLILLLFVLTGCNESGGGSSSHVSGSDNDSVSGDTDSPSTGTAATLSGRVADGYLNDARVFLDRNANRSYDEGEPMTYSTAQGHYTLEISPGEGDLYPVVVEAIAGRTIDEDNGLYVEEGYLLESPASHWRFVSPLTTLVKMELDKNPSFSMQQAMLRVREQLGIADEVSLMEDYLAAENSSVARSEEYKRTHRAARTIAMVMAQLRRDISDNLGRELRGEDQETVAYLVSDKVLEQACQIRQALDDERNYDAATDVDNLVNSILDELQPEVLGQDVLDFYAERIDQSHDVWDMTPPQVVTSMPGQGQSTSVDAMVTVTFDETVDAMLLENGSFEITGPDGPVFGALSYDEEQRQLTFIPDNYLLPYTEYLVTLKSDLCDAKGNPLGHDRSWAFTTVFDQTPPELPEFL